ncbi:hypothetical protein D3C81_2022160 [compost metagenome]
MHTAIGAATAYTTWPAGMKKASAATLVAIFTSFEQAEARMKSKPKTRMNRKIKKLPVPGPNRPS